MSINHIISNLEIAETLIRRTLPDDLTTTKGSPLAGSLGQNSAQPILTPYFNDAEVSMLTAMAQTLWLLRVSLKPPPNPAS
jgi:hypothetical protein